MVTPKKGKETPAEQLLRLIEGPGRTVPPAKFGGAFSVVRLGDLLQQRVVSLWHRLVPIRRQTDTFLRNLQLLSRALWVILAGLGLYLVVDLVIVPGKLPAHHHAIPVVGGSPAALMVPGEPVRTMQPLSDYLSAVSQRNPFTGGVAATEESVAARPTKHRLEELAGTLVVVGIDRGAKPEAIIEDTAQQRTYFVKVGDEINGMQVKDISAKGVIVSYEGEEGLLK